MNSARKAGREIGRAIEDLWIPDAVLMRRVRRTIGPRIKLFRSDQDKTAEAWGGLCVFVVFLAVLVIASGLTRVLPVDLVEDLQPLRNVREALAGIPIVVVFGAMVSAVLFAALAVIAASIAKAKANEAHRDAVKALHLAAFEGARAVLTARQSKVGMPIESSRGRRFPPPSMRPQGVDARGAEEVVAQWMRHLGDVDAELTSYTGDGGIDVVGARSIAQVKHYSSAVGVAAIRELAGVSMQDQRKALFFTSSGYAAGAVAFADRAGIALFVYDVERANLTALNATAKALMHNGL